MQSVGDYYTLVGAAEALGVSFWQVWRAVRHHQTPTLSLGQTLLVKLADVQEALAERVGASLEHEAPGLVAALEPQVSFDEAVAYYQALARQCPQCESDALVSEAGCRKCRACGWAAC